MTGFSGELDNGFHFLCRPYEGAIRFSREKRWGRDRKRELVYSLYILPRFNIRVPNYKYVNEGNRRGK